MREELERLVSVGTLGRQHIEPLLALVSHGFGLSRSFGAGKIAALDPTVGRLTVDFAGRPGHAMDLRFAAENLKPIPPGHILARKLVDRDGVRQMAALHHVDLIKVVLDGHCGKATPDQIQQLLADIVTDDWKKWWEVARREMKRDGHFQVPTKKTEPVVYEALDVGATTRALNDVRAAKGLKNRLVAVHELERVLPDLPDKAGPAQEAVALLNADIASHQKTMPWLALEAIFARDALRDAAGLAAGEGELQSDAIWAAADRLPTMLGQISNSKYRRTLESYAAARTDSWVHDLLGVLNSSPTKLAGEIAGILIQRGHILRLKDQLVRLVSQHGASSELLLWLAKERSDVFADVLGPEVFRAMLSAIERDQFNEKKSNKLRDHILGDQDLLTTLVGGADLEVVKDLTRALQLSPSFDDMDKRSLLARIVKLFPSIQALISGDRERQEAALFVSWSSLERRQAEYQDIVQSRIPANSRDIAVARSYGDLRENHEYKAAKEAQKVLMRRKAELERDLTRARGTDFAGPRLDVVSIGTRIEISDLATGARETYTILGAWDFDADRAILSYLSPMALALLNRKPGEEVEFEHPGHTGRFRVDSIAAARLEAAPTAAATVVEEVMAPSPSEAAATADTEVQRDTGLPQ
ncbi:MAG: GreA/GreB family elongation factor [Limisphaerales bacterium]